MAPETNPAAGRGEALLPASLRKEHDASTDPVLEALRAEVRQLLETPFTTTSLRDAEALLRHASQILMMRKGAPTGMRRRHGNYISQGYDSADVGEGEPVYASAPVSETMGTHAFREIIGITTKAIEAFTVKKEEPLPQAKRSPNSFAIESLTRALAQAEKIESANLREDVIAKIRAQFDEELLGDVERATFVEEPGMTTAIVVAEKPFEPELDPSVRFSAPTPTPTPTSPLGEGSMVQ